MPLKAPKPTGTGPGIPAPEGNHRAVCIGLYDLGTQPSDLYGPKHQVVFTFELVDEMMPSTADKEDRPFVISQFCSFSMHEKSTMRKILESWRGRAFTEKELGDFDLLSMIGKPALVQVVHEMREDGSARAKIKAVTAPPKGMTKVTTTYNTPQWFSLQDGKGELDEKIPEWIRDKIKLSEEYRNLVNGVPNKPLTQAEADEATKETILF